MTSSVYTRFPARLAGRFFFRLEFYRLLVNKDQDFPDRPGD
jgi:hypothetical protein